jgi:hypothetical protein
MIGDRAAHYEPVETPALPSRITHDNVLINREL